MPSDRKNAVALILAYFCNDTSGCGQCPFQVIDPECKTPCPWSSRYSGADVLAPCTTVTAKDWLEWMGTPDEKG
jgi:hypothetical protein